MIECLSRWPWRGPLYATGGSMRKIAEAVAVEHGLTLADLKNLSRRRAICHPRQEAMAAMKVAGFSNQQIVNFFGLKNHTSCVHARQAVRDRALADQEAA